MKHALYRVGAAAKRAGLSPHTLRVWERRHGPFATHRSPGGNRLYGDHDVERISLLKRLVDAGQAISTVAPLQPAELRRLAARMRPEPALAPRAVAEPALRQLRAALPEMDVRAIEEVLARASLALPPRELIETVISPFLEDVGRGWEEGALSVAHEHAATAVLRNQLGLLLRSLRPSRGARVVVVATPEGDPHELGALGAALVAASLGCETVYLGPSVPARDLAAAVETASARAVLLSCALPAARRLRAVRDALPEQVLLVAGGPGAPSPLALQDLEATLAALRSGR